MTAKSIWQRIRSVWSSPASEGGGIVPKSDPGGDVVTAALSAGIGVMSREQADALGPGVLGRPGIAVPQMVIVENDGSLTGHPKDIERAAAYGMLRRYEREGES